MYPTICESMQCNMPCTFVKGHLQQLWIIRHHMKLGTAQNQMSHISDNSEVQSIYSCKGHTNSSSYNQNPQSGYSWVLTKGQKPLNTTLEIQNRFLPLAPSDSLTIFLNNWGHPNLS